MISSIKSVLLFELTHKNKHAHGHVLSGKFREEISRTFTIITSKLEIELFFIEAKNLKFFTITHFII